MSFNRAISSIIVLSLLLLIAGCGGSSPVNTTTSQSSVASTTTAVTEQPTETTSQNIETEVIELTLVWTTVTDQVAQSWDTLWEKFNIANPGIKVSFNKIPNINETIRVQLAAKAGPDMMMMDAFDVMDFAKAGHLYNLEDAASSLNWKDILYNWAYNSCAYDSDLYALPWSSEMTVLNANMKLIEEYGWEIPKTRSEFVEICEAAKENGIIPISYGFSGLPLLNQWIFDHYINTVAGNETLIAILKNEKKWTDPLIAEAFELIKLDWDAGYFQDGMSHAITADEANSMFFSGKSLFDTQGTWLCFGRTNEEIESDVMKFDSFCWPSMKDGVSPSISFACGEVIGVSSYSQYHDEIIVALDFLMTDDHAICEAVAGGVIPPPRDIDVTLIPDTATIGAKHGMRIMDELPEQTNNISYAPWGFYPTSCNQYLYENMDQILLGKITVEEYLNHAQEAYEKDIEDGYVFAG